MAGTASLDYEHARSLMTENRLAAGGDYLKALLHLGLDPDIMAWVYVARDREMELALVTTLVDRIGPKPIYDLLFRAYELAGTPRSVDPFVVSLYSPNMAFAIDLKTYLRIPESGWLDPGAELARVHVSKAWFVIGFTDQKLIFGPGIYRVKSKQNHADVDFARWRKFEQNVLALAA